MNRDVFLSILTMDAYNRGYNQKIHNLPSSGSLGNATIKAESPTGENSPEVGVGFYAIQYEWNGETIISFRGTDGASDLLHGWTTGTGWSDRAQARLAIEFYEEITGRWVHSPTAPSAVTLTGHSLGGGLAGLVSALSGAKATLFDHMPFGRAAIGQATLMIERLQSGEISASDTVHPAEAQHVIDMIAALGDSATWEELGFRRPNIGLPNGYFVEGEVRFRRQCAGRRGPRGDAHRPARRPRHCLPRLWRRGRDFAVRGAVRPHRHLRQGDDVLRQEPPVEAGRRSAGARPKRRRRSHLRQGRGPVRHERRLFAESLGWIGPEDGFLVFDTDGSRTIDDVSEMFGSPGVPGFAELAVNDNFIGCGRIAA